MATGLSIRPLHIIIIAAEGARYWPGTSIFIEGQKMSRAISELIKMNPSLI